MKDRLSPQKIPIKKTKKETANTWRKWCLPPKEQYKDLLHKLPNELRKQVFDDFY